MRARRLSANQIGLIHVAKTQLGLAEDDYRAILRRVAGCDSAKALSQPGFAVVMEELDRLGFRSASPRKPFASQSRPGFATNKQVSMIRSLWAEWSGSEGEAGLNTWLERTAKTSALRFLSIENAPNVIAGLKAMCARRQAQT